MKRTFLKVLIMAGGTGGHIMPALAVAEELRKQGAEVFWLGSRNGLESKLVPKQDFPIYYLSVQGLRGKRFSKLLWMPFKLIKALYQGWRIIRQVKPQVVIGMGGFASGPGGLAAVLTRKPLIIHEQNTIPGVTNKILGRLGSLNLQAFPETFAPTYKPITVGNPIRHELIHLSEPSLRFADIHERPLRLLVLGGSQGAKFLNELIPQAMTKTKEKLDIWHVSGEKNYASTQRMYQKHSLSVKMDPFLENISDAYLWADLVICRAGALTVAELAAVGVASILVPFPSAVDDHQTSNALYLVKAGAALLIPEIELSEKKLLACLVEFQQNRHKIIKMAQAARQLACVDAAQTVAEHCIKIAK